MMENIMTENIMMVNTILIRNLIPLLFYFILSIHHI